jgi:hypothetical protein
MEKRFVDPQNLSMPHRSSHNPAKDIAPALIGGKNPIVDQKRSGPAVIGDDPEGNVRFRIPAIGDLADRFHLFKDGLEEIGLIIAPDVLKDRCDSFQTHSRIDTGFFDRMKGSSRIPIELHKDKIPEFQKPVALTSHLTIGTTTTDTFPLIDHEFRAGAAGPCLSHGPEVILLPQPDDPFRRKTNLSPEMEGIVIFEIDRDPHLLGGQPPFADEEVPSHLDGLFLKIISEREVPQHFEERVMAGCLSNDLEVVMLPSGPDTFLGGGGAFGIPGLFR